MQHTRAESKVIITNNNETNVNCSTETAPRDLNKKSQHSKIDKNKRIKIQSKSGCMCYGRMFQHTSC